jgi:molybdenum cofactor cytidylyltransferase
LILSFILAAGRSERFGTQKLSTFYRGKRLLQWSIDVVKKLPTDKLIVVSEELNLALFDVDPFTIVVNKRPDLGLSESIKCGIKKADGYEGVLIFLGDMPGVNEYHSRKVLSLDRSKIIFPSHEGIKGFPVYLPSKYFDEVMKLEGDVGLRELIFSHKEMCLTYEEGKACTFDVDTEEDIEK